MPTTIPDALRARAQWVAWKYETRDGKPTKVPINPMTGGLASVSDPATWSSYDDVILALDREIGTGIGYVLTAEDPFVGIDLDGCRDPESGFVSEWANQIVRLLNSYTEVTPSGAGLRVWVMGVLPSGHKSKRSMQGPKVGDRSPALEVYDRGRFLTVTGQRDEAKPADVQERSKELLEVYVGLFGPMSSDAITSNSNTLLPLPVPPLRIGDRLRILVERGWHEGCGFPSPSELDYAIASEMLRGGHTDAEVVWVFKAPLFGFSRGKHHRDDYIQRTLAAARASIPAANLRTPLSSFTLEDAAAADWTLPDPLVGNLIFPESITLLAGPPKVGKTFFVMQMLAALASGTPFMDEFVVPAPLRCLHLTAETPAAYYWDRWRNQFDARFAAARGRIRFSTEKGLNVVDDFEAIGDLIRSHSPHLVVFDTWIRYHNADENDAAEMKQAMTQIDKFIKAFSVSVLLVHHTKKASFEEVDDAMSLIRGTGVLRSHPNTNLVMLPSKEEYAQGVVKHVRFSMESNFVPPLDAIMLERNDEGLFEKTQRTTPAAIPAVLAILRAHKDHTLSIKALGVQVQQDTGISLKATMQALRAVLPAELRIDRKDDGKEWVTYIGGGTDG